MIGTEIQPLVTRLPGECAIPKLSNHIFIYQFVSDILLSQESRRKLGEFHFFNTVKNKCHAATETVVDLHFEQMS